MSELVLENYWRMYDLPIAGYKAAHIFGQDDLQYSTDSASLNSAVVRECISAPQGTIEAWVRPAWNGNDGMIYALFDKDVQNADNRLVIYKNTDGDLECLLRDKDSTNHLVEYDISSWIAGGWHHIVVTWDFGNDSLALYTDGTVRDNTPSVTLSSDSFDDLSYDIQVGANYTQTAQLNGLLWLRVLDRPLSSTEVSDLYNSGSGSADSFIVTPDTKLLILTSDDSTDVVYHHFGKTVSAITAGGTEATLTTAAGSDTSLADGDPVCASDALGYALQGYVDGTPSSTSVLVDNGAGGAVSGIEDVGRSLSFNGSESVDTSHDFSWAKTDPFSMSCWFSVSDVSGYKAIAGKASWEWSWIFINDTVRFVYFDAGGSDELVLDATVEANKWYHIAVTYDGGGNGTVYLNSVPVDTDTVVDDFKDRANGVYIGAAYFGAATRYFNGNIADFCIFDIQLTAADVLWLATNPGATLADIFTNTSATQGGGAADDDVLLYHNYRNGNLTDLSEYGYNGIHSGTPSYETSAFLSRSLVADGDMENGGIGGWTIVGTPTSNAKETDTDYGTQSLQWTSDAAGEGYSQGVSASNGDKFYLFTRYKVTSGSFKINVTNGGGDLDTGINDATWTSSELIVSATGNLTVQWLSEASGDDVNISRVELLPCVAGNALSAAVYYTLVYNTDTGDTGAEWSGLGSDATETAAGDLYIRDDTAAASTAIKSNGGKYPLNLAQVFE